MRVLTMKRVAVISVAVVAAPVVIGLAFFGLANIFGEPKRAVITISGASGKCVALTDPQTLYADRFDRVHWEIRDPTPCLPENVEVEVRFADGRPLLWLIADRARGKRAIENRIQPFVPKGKRYQYKVWAVGPSGDYEMEDPVLEIAQ
jgi:hypothetical protein